MTLAELNEASETEASEALLACCGSQGWVTRMLARRPFDSAGGLHVQADTSWFELSRDGWLEAFAKHPKIGETSSSAWSKQEQSGMSQAGKEVAGVIREMNASYEKRFGYIFIVCASGRSADEMRVTLERRLLHDPEEEIRIAAREQAKIMHLRLNKLLQAK